MDSIMSENKLTPEQLKALLQYASQRLGTTPEKLADTVNNKGIDELASKLSPADRAKFQAVVSDKNKLEQMLNSPQAQQLIEKLMNKK